MDKDASQWNIDEVVAWVEENGFGDHRDKFRG